jgi:hypothetical protein
MNSKVVNFSVRRSQRNKKKKGIGQLYFEVSMEPEEVNLFRECIQQRKQDICLLNYIAAEERNQKVESIEDYMDILTVLENFKKAIGVYRILSDFGMHSEPFKLILHVYELDYFTSIIGLQHAVYKDDENEALAGKLKLLMDKTVPYCIQHKSIIDEFFSTYTEKQRIFLLQKSRSLQLQQEKYYQPLFSNKNFFAYFLDKKFK